jgi:hypothetical protein
MDGMRFGRVLVRVAVVFAERAGDTDQKHDREGYPMHVVILSKR